MSALETILGPSLVGKDGSSIPTATAMADAEYVGIYFSAHWCPPCRGFTPRLSAWYTENKDKLKLRLVFASADRKKDEYDSYFREMSWDASLGFSAARQDELSSKFGVEGIPTLVIIDKNGAVVTTEGREGVVKDPSGASFPWKPRSALEVLAAAGAVAADGSAVDVASLDYLLLYFSAHWCGPCRAFTPEFARWYTGHKAALAAEGKRVEAVFVSSDRDDASFAEYRSTMPWAAMPFAARAEKDELSSMFKVRGIPTLVLVDRTGAVVQADARSKVAADPDGFPWGPKPVETLDSAASGSINEFPTVILFTDKLTDAAAEVAVNEAFASVAAAHWDAAAGKPSGALRFAVGADGDDAVEPVRNFLKAAGDKDGPTAVRVDFVDIRKQRKAKMAVPAGTLPTADTLAAFVAGCLDGSLPTPLRG